MKGKYSVETIVGVVDIILLTTFLLGISIIGGEAVSGKIENGKYFIWDSTIKYKNGTKAYIEVSKTVYIYSTVHFYLVLVTILVFFIIKIKKWITTIKQKWKDKRSLEE